MTERILVCASVASNRFKIVEQLVRQSSIPEWYVYSGAKRDVRWNRVSKVRELQLPTHDQPYGLVVEMPQDGALENKVVEQLLARKECQQVIVSTLSTAHVEELTRFQRVLIGFCRKTKLIEEYYSVLVQPLDLQLTLEQFRSQIRALSPGQTLPFGATPKPATTIEPLTDAAAEPVTVARQEHDLSLFIIGHSTETLSASFDRWQKHLDANTILRECIQDSSLNIDETRAEAYLHFDVVDGKLSLLLPCMFAFFRQERKANHLKLCSFM